jgi:NAD+ synthase (glutamine-hydrolysing)
VRIALAQINPIVGDLRGNRTLCEEAASKAAAAGADLVVLSELALSGYPPMDLLERHGFVADQERELQALARSSERIAIAVGAILPADGPGPRSLLNAAVLLAGGKRVATQAKTLLPTYDVFDERRYFAPADARQVCSLGETTLGLSVCEDAWTERVPYASDPLSELHDLGADLVLNLSASPWHVGKSLERREMFARTAKRLGVPVVFVNQVGGNDELIFDGASFVIDSRGRIRGALPLFKPALEIVDLESAPGRDPADVEEESGAAQLAAGLVTGIGDYFHKQKLPPGAVIGLSGGIDSAVTAYLAVEALGAPHVLGVLMPGPFSSDHSIRDAEVLAQHLGIETRTVRINPIYERYLDVFADLFGPREDYGLAQQNIQARIRGAILMAISNAENRLVLATGNKSELSVGYCTLYGDTVGGIAVLGDVYKRDVYELARHANRQREVIPQHCIEKPPSAELAPDQLDQDDLPPYPILDAILEQAIEGGRGAAAIEPPRGVSREQVAQIVRRLDRNEYKRRQAPLILRASPKAFGTGRRLPIVHAYG